MTRPSRAVIDLDALEFNYKVLRERHGGKAFAVLKANAYGHGAVACAKKLEPTADAFAVAFLKEGLELRQAGIKKPILILEGAFDDGELHQAAENDLWLSVHQVEQIEMLERVAALSPPLNIWLKLDTGMNRLGLDPDQLSSHYDRLMKLTAVSKIRFMTHFSRADEAELPMTIQQITVFKEAIKGLDGETSVCNSAGSIALQDHGAHWSRLGIGLYGANPIESNVLQLKPVMTLTSQVFSVKEVLKGEQVGYGGAFVAKRDSRIGMLAIGYADGYPRHAMAGPVSIDGQLSCTVGRVSMDMLAIDLTDFPGAGVGTDVELWGRRLSVNEVAKHAQTISYELLCNTKRVEFEYV
jgi:alanine racemase